MKKTGRYIFYIATIMICVVVLILAIYYSFIDKPENVIVVNGIEQNIIPIDNIQTTKEEFGNEFNNTINLGTFDDSTVTKKNPELGMVYIVNSADGVSPSFTIDENGKTFNAYIPMFNIDSPICDGYNEKINSLIETLNQFLADDSQDFKGTMVFGANVVDNILSVGIKVDYKVGYDAQKTIYQTYNYNLSTGTNVAIMDIVNTKGLKTDDMNAKIKQTVIQAASDAQGMQNAGYEVYQRNTDLAIYDVTSPEAASNLLFILGKNGKLFIVYPYGNQNSTQEYDVIKF